MTVELIDSASAHLEAQEKPWNARRTLAALGRVPSPRRCAYVTMVLGGILCALLVLATFSLKQVSRAIRWDQEQGRGPPSLASGEAVRLAEPVPEYMRLENVLAGPPTAHVHDALRNDTKYLTSWYGAGFNNDVMTVGNIIYLSMLTERVPIIAPLHSAIDGDHPPIAFSEVFNTTYLMQQLRMPVLEWHQVKDWEAGWALNEPDEIGCWNVWEAADMHATEPRGSWTPTLLNLDISYTTAPSYVKLIPGFEHDSHSPFFSLVRLAFPETREEVLADPQEHPTRPAHRSGAIIPPEEQLLCYDYLYYATGILPGEYDWDYSPVWRFVMRHFVWTDRIQALAQEYLRRTFALSEGAPIPPYITIHARRGDFLGTGICGDTPANECFAPLSAFERRVREVQDELRARRGIEATHVIMTSDEKDPAWWADVAARGWLRVDHAAARSVELYGNWYPVIIDAAIQSSGTGFVGTQYSTFSIMARRRVQEWNGGEYRMVKWGRPDSDDH